SPSSMCSKPPEEFWQRRNSRPLLSVTPSKTAGKSQLRIRGLYATHGSLRDSESYESIERSAEVRPVSLAGLHSPRFDYQRRTEATHRRRRPARNDLEPRHFREGDRRQQGL